MFVPVANAAIAEKFPYKKGERMSIFSSITMGGRIIAPILGGYVLSAGYILSKDNWNYYGLYTTVAIAGSCAFFVALMLLGSKLSNRITEKSFEGKRYFPKEIALVSIVEAAQYYTFGAYEFYLVDFAIRSLSLDALSISIIPAAQLAAIALVTPFAGRFSDRVGRKTPIVVGLIVGSVPLFATPFVGSFLELVLVSVVYGIGFSLVTSSTGPFVSDSVSKELYGTAMGFLSTIMDVGQTLGPIITGFIFATALGYLGAFISLGAILLFFGLALFLQQLVRKKDISNL